ncbi:MULTISPECIES: glutaminyl-peptide cyclotransferase [Maribacter]|uniref:Glutaminyl-peptide cyclotransferase n=2 Tax=Maribacter flavus TaxID=1658664 RepID=A0ABU7III3_9FLAO|nr:MULTISPECIES: glutaminyl-peptide cyclotransferase [Maribacter]MDC6405558.1 glutaminyl-peptide cyclotransferase [Maribacter sp. PR66]MEE1972674.1 glutaminyl-peptide cyclotransferase [Maribacter flavus]
MLFIENYSQIVYSIKLPMKIIGIPLTLLIVLLFFACGSGNQKPSSLFTIELEGNAKEVRQNDALGVSLKNIKNKEIESVIYSIDGNELPLVNDQLEFSIPKLGNKILKASVTYEGNTVEVTKNLKVLASKAPDIYTYTILNEFPHDPNAYTQGLEFYKDTLYEGTGKNGRSFLRKFDYKTGKVYQQIDLDETYFGEGITILGNKIYQLTWRSGMGFIYDLKDMKKLDNFQYGKSREGWGLANDGEKLYKSDGTDKIWILNPETLVEEDHIEIATNKSLFADTNELEYVNGKIYANVYQKPGVMIIDAKSGAIEGVINFGGLSDKVTKTENWVDTENVLNGIAYHPERKTFFVTGKDWDKLFEVQIQKK